MLFAKTLTYLPVRMLRQAALTVAEKETKADSATTATEKESKETTSNVIEGISKKMINAADLFKAGYGKSDLATLLEGIKIFK